VRYAVEGADYEIDLSAKNATAFCKQLAPRIEHARRAGRAPGRPDHGQTVSVQLTSGPGRNGTAWRSGRTAASRRAWRSNTTRPAGAIHAAGFGAGTAQIAPSALHADTGVARSAADEYVLRDDPRQSFVWDRAFLGAGPVTEDAWTGRSQGICSDLAEYHLRGLACA
jgi:hypothetical protein